MRPPEIIADSISPADIRLTTFAITLPRSILAEFNTHRAVSKNAGSSRAIPIETMIRWVQSEPYIPEWTLNQKGMRGREPGIDWDRATAGAIWLDTRDHVIGQVRKLIALGVHKQEANRLLEPWAHVNVVATGDQFGWANLFHLRTHKDAHPAFRAVATAMAELYRDGTPAPRCPSDRHSHASWHLPFIFDLERVRHPLNQLLVVSAARCARTSYRTFDGKVASFEEDLELFRTKLAGDPMHASPLEHQACASRSKDLRSGNFQGWVQHRKLRPGEWCREFDFAKLAKEVA